MIVTPHQLTLDEWDEHYARLREDGLRESGYGGRLSRHVEREGDLRLQRLRFDNSVAALRLWNFLLTENERLRTARDGGERLIGALKDLGTVPVMAYSLPGLRAFYPDGTWWTPCLMEHSDRLLQRAEALGLDASFCPVRAMLGAFENEEHFPRPDLLICSTGAICDDLSAVAQRLERLGHQVLWWEIPRRRSPEPHEMACDLPGGATAPKGQVDCVHAELASIAAALGQTAGQPLSDRLLSNGIVAANVVRRTLRCLRETVYSSRGVVLPAVEMMIAEMLAIHFCSDREECLEVLKALLAEAQRREREHQFVGPPDAVRVFWVNPVADLCAMNLLEDCGGCLCGTDFMFSHALDMIAEDLPPLEALARTALSDPMVGSVVDRARRIVSECQQFGAEAVVVSRIPGASHCPWEGTVICDMVRQRTGLPAIELEIPSVCGGLIATLQTRLQALVEIVRTRRRG